MQEENDRNEERINSKYHDKFNCKYFQTRFRMFFVRKLLNFDIGSIMMDADSTKARNEIMRRIKLYQMKERNMPNFIRKKREEMLAKVRIY